MWDAFLFCVALLFFARFWGLPSLLWKIICPHFRIWSIDFLVFSATPGFTYGGEGLAYFGTQFVAISEVWALIFFCFLG